VTGLAPETVSRLAQAIGAEVIETHISWVLLAGDLAYKLKKPLHLPFVDYSTPERRLHFCREEVRLNRRLAPGLYLGVSRVTGREEQPAIDGPGAVLDYAVRMKRFPPGALLSERLEAGTLDAWTVDRFAQVLAAFHAEAATVSAAFDPDGSLPLRRARAALAGAPLLPEAEADALGRWLDLEWERCRPAWLGRLRDGRVRECHGDLHLANVVALDGQIAAFDCIEFDLALRSLDPVDDAAFAMMDFAARGRPDLGWRFLNGWLERTGEYDGLPLLRFWLASRALVRGQVENLRRPAVRSRAGMSRRRWPGHGRGPGRWSSPPACPGRARASPRSNCWSAPARYASAPTSKESACSDCPAMRTLARMASTPIRRMRPAAPTSGCWRSRAPCCMRAFRSSWMRLSCAAKNVPRPTRSPARCRCPLPSWPAKRRWTYCASDCVAAAATPPRRTKRCSNACAVPRNR